MTSIIIDSKVILFKKGAILDRSQNLEFFCDGNDTRTGWKDSILSFVRDLVSKAFKGYFFILFVDESSRKYKKGLGRSA